MKPWLNIERTRIKEGSDERHYTVAINLKNGREAWCEVLTPNEADKLALELVRFADKARKETA